MKPNSYITNHHTALKKYPSKSNCLVQNITQKTIKKYKRNINKKTKLNKNIKKNFLNENFSREIMMIYKKQVNNTSEKMNIENEGFYTDKRIAEKMFMAKNTQVEIPQITPTNR